MSDTKQLAAPEHDFTLKDLEIIDHFKEKGMISLSLITDTDVERCMKLYLDGKTYRQIAIVTKIKKDVILFLAHRFRWWELKQEMLDELMATLPQKILDSKLQSQEFFLHLILAYQKKIGKNIDKYLKTDDESWADKVDTKDLNMLLKVTELLHRLNSEGLSGLNHDKSLVSLNGMGEGVDIVRTGANSVEITPKSPFSNKLKAFADMKRASEKENLVPPKPNDITGEVINESSTTTPKE